MPELDFELSTYTRSMKKLLSFLTASLITLVSLAQDQHLVDSLQAALKTSKQDTVRANILNALFVNCYYTDPDKAMEYGKEMLQLSEQIGFRKGIGTAYNCIGVVYYIKGDYFLALDFYKKSLEIKLELNNKIGASSTYSNIGIIYAMQGNFPEALKNNFSALKLREETGIKKDIADSYISLGNVYTLLGNTSEALKYQLKALSIKKEIGDKLGLARSYSNIGNIYIDQENYNEALLNYLESLKIVEELSDKKDMATVYNGIGIIYFRQGNYSEGLKNSFTAIKISEESGSIEGISACYNNIANCFREQKKYIEASDYYNKALALAKEMGSLEISKSSYDGLTKLDSAQGNFKQSLEHYKLFIATRDSMFNEESTKKNVQQQMQYDFDKKQVADSLNYAQEKEIDEIKLQKQKAYTYSGLIGMSVTIVLLFFVYRNYNKQRIANQKLKEAQEQLIQSEKLAAFGTMATRMAHEIQNPLNFVNHFSEISKELMDDIKNETATEKEKREAINLLNGNLEKIYHHGKRASVIIQQLQDHNRAGTTHEFFEENEI
jgi:two-component system, NtrC family, sensor kinase